MQSLLHVYYVVMGVYGWFSWKRNAEQEGGRIYRWTVRRHLLVALLLLTASALSAQFLARETQAAWPLLDSFTTWTSLLATWMLARSVLENWLYWICADLIMVYLFVRQGYPYTAGLFFVYTVVSVPGSARMAVALPKAGALMPTTADEPAAAALAWVPGVRAGAAPLRIARLAGWQRQRQLARGHRRRAASCCASTVRRGAGPGSTASASNSLHEAAARAGLAPRLLLRAIRTAYRCANTSTGAAGSAADFLQPLQLRRLGERLAQLHALEVPPGVAPFDPVACAREYL